MRKTTVKGLGAAILGMTVLVVLLVVPAFAQSDLPSPEASVQPTVTQVADAPDDIAGEVITPPGGLAFTGDEVTVWMVIAAGLLVVGSGLLFVARRRAKTANK